MARYLLSSDKDGGLSNEPQRFNVRRLMSHWLIQQIILLLINIFKYALHNFFWQYY
jgi:hypothetical protein